MPIVIDPNTGQEVELSPWEAAQLQSDAARASRPLSSASANAFNALNGAMLNNSSLYTNTPKSSTFGAMKSVLGGGTPSSVTTASRGALNAINSASPLTTASQSSLNALNSYMQGQWQRTPSSKYESMLPVFSRPAGQQGGGAPQGGGGAPGGVSGMGGMGGGGGGLGGLAQMMAGMMGGQQQKPIETPKPPEKKKTFDELHPNGTPSGANYVDPRRPLTWMGGGHPAGDTTHGQGLLRDMMSKAPAQNDPPPPMGPPQPAPPASTTKPPKEDDKKPKDPAKPGKKPATRWPTMGGGSRLGGGIGAYLGRSGFGGRLGR